MGLPALEVSFASVASVFRAWMGGWGVEGGGGGFPEMVKKDGEGRGEGAFS